MARRSRKGDREELKQELAELVSKFDTTLRNDGPRSQALQLVPVYHTLRDLGASLITDADTDAALDRIISYMKMYPGEVIRGSELMVVAGIDDYARRIRQLRVEEGWSILSGVTVAEMRKESESEAPEDWESLPRMKTDDYVLLSTTRDEGAASRWKMANGIRRGKGGVKAKVLKYFLANVGKQISGEELRYLANKKNEWPRRVRELRTENGWRIATRTTGRPTLPVGTYVLETADQAPEQDRHIPDPVRYAVMHRDNYSCIDCKWDSRKDWSPSAPRHLELHHKVAHVDGGENTEGNLITLCNICHVERHRKGER